MPPPAGSSAPQKVVRFGIFEADLAAGELPWAGLALAVILATGTGLWLLKRSDKAPEAALVPVPLTSYRGWELSASFSPDGTRVAFCLPRKATGSSTRTAETGAPT